MESCCQKLTIDIKPLDVATKGSLYSLLRMLGMARKGGLQLSECVFFAEPGMHPVAIVTLECFSCLVRLFLEASLLDRSITL
jgi:hypothetical protein